MSLERYIGNHRNMCVRWWLLIIGSYNPHDTETYCIGRTTFLVNVGRRCSHFSLQPNPACGFCHFFRGKTNYINLGSFLIKPVQRVMRYPLLLMELLGATPESHHDRPQLTKALQAVKEINVNINEYKRRKDLGKNLWLIFSLWLLLSSAQSECSPPTIHSGEVQERRRGHVHWQDLQAKHALHY